MSELKPYSTLKQVISPNDLTRSGSGKLWLPNPLLVKSPEEDHRGKSPGRPPGGNHRGKITVGKLPGEITGGNSRGEIHWGKSPGEMT